MQLTASGQVALWGVSGVLRARGPLFSLDSGLPADADFGHSAPTSDGHSQPIKPNDMQFTERWTLGFRGFVDSGTVLALSYE